MTLAFGGDYNPEQWPAGVWAEDDALMRAAGVNTVTVGVFSWALLEPSEGRFEFGWLDSTLDRLAANGIQVVLATPTASPPPWFSFAYPDALPVTRDGVRRWHGSRDTYCAAAPAYRAACVRIAGELARRYADHPALTMWHVHNEYGTWCWCDHAAAAFRSWLRLRYGGLDELNEAWGTAFWSQRYSCWEQILPPRATQWRSNPGHDLDFRRFWSDELLACFREQRDVLRALCPGVPVTTNFMGPEHLALDVAAFGREVDVVAVDHYLSSADPSEGAADIAFCSDWARSAGGGRPWLLMEQAPSVVMASGRMVHRPPGRMLRDSLGYVAGGARGVMFFQWRASRAGAELYHPGLVPHAGPSSRIFAEAESLGAALARLPEVAGSVVAASAAVLVDTGSRWALESPSMPFAPGDVSHLAVARRAHGALWRAGIACDVVPADAVPSGGVPAGGVPADTDISGYRLVIVPAVYLMSAAVASALGAFVAGGGHLVVTFLSGVADEHHRVVTGGYPGLLRDLLGVRVEEFHPLPPGVTVALSSSSAGLDGATGSIFSERMQSCDEVEVVARYRDGVLAGLPAVTRNGCGAGVAWYVSTWPSFSGALLRDAAAAAGVGPVLPDVPPGVAVSRRRAPGGRSWLFAFNDTDAPVVVPAAGVDLLSGEAADPLRLPPRGVAVLREPP